MKTWKRLLGAAMATIAIANADTVELWTGEKAKGVDIIGIKEGALHCQYRGKVRKLELANIKSWNRSKGLASIRHYGAYTHGRTEGRLLRVDLRTEDSTVIMPLIRVFTCHKTSGGAYVIYQTQNIRCPDPTRTEKLPEVDANMYKRKFFFLSRAADAVAHRIEVWYKGELAAVKDEAPTDDNVQPDWFRQLPLKSARSLKELKQADIEAAMASIEEEQEELSPTSLTSWKIMRVSTLPQPPKEYPTARVNYTYLRKNATETVLPEVIFYYVATSETEDTEIGSINVEPNAGDTEEVINDRLSRTPEKDFPAHIRVSMLETQKDPTFKRLVHWRVEMLVDGQLVASQEKDSDFKRTLPPKWWQ